MSYRFVRYGTTPNWKGPQVDNPAGFIVAQAPVPAGQDDPGDKSNLDIDQDSDPVYIRGLTSATVFLYSDTTCAADLLVSVAPTPTGPWSAIGVASVNPSLASPIAVDVFTNGRAEYAMVTTSNYVSGNPRALLVGDGY